MAHRGPSKGVTRRRQPAPEVTYLTAGQLPKLQAATDVDDAEPVSQVRSVFPGHENILAIFREAQRLKA